MSLSRERTGELWVILSGVLWCLFPIVSVEILREVQPVFAAGASTLLSALFFAALLTVRKKWSDVMRRDAWLDLLKISLLIGVIFYGLYFTGLKSTSPGSGSIVGMMEILFSFLLLGVILKREKIVSTTIFGALLMIIAGFIVLLPSGFSWEPGNWIIVLATIFPPIGNDVSRRARGKVSSECIMFVRSVISGAFLLFLSFILEGSTDVTVISTHTWWLLAGNGMLLMGLSKIFWIEGIFRIPVTKAISLLSAEPALTLFFVWMLQGTAPTKIQLLSVIPMILGVILLTRKTPPEELTVE